MAGGAQLVTRPPARCLAGRAGGARGGTLLKICLSMFCKVKRTAHSTSGSPQIPSIVCKNTMLVEHNRRVPKGRGNVFYLNAFRTVWKRENVKSISNLLLGVAFAR